MILIAPWSWRQIYIITPIISPGIWSGFHSQHKLFVCLILFCFSDENGTFSDFSEIAEKYHAWTNTTKVNIKPVVFCQALGFSYVLSSASLQLCCCSVPQLNTRSVTWYVRPSSITPPCRQPRSIFGGFYLPFLENEVCYVRSLPRLKVIPT